METAFNYIDKEDAVFSSDERKWITRIRKLAERFPDKVTILKQPEENDGCIYARLPQDFLKITPKKRVNYTDEQIATLSERLKSLRKAASDLQNGEQHE